MDVSPDLPAHDAPRPLLESPSPASFSQNVHDALRLALWREPLFTTTRMSGLTTVAICAVAAVGSLVIQLIAADGAWRRFNPYGLNGVVAGLAVAVTVVVVFSRRDRTQATARGLTLVLALMFFAGFCEHIVYHALGPDLSQDHAPTVSSLFWAIATLPVYVWLAGATRQAFKAGPSADGLAVQRPGWRAVGFLVVLTLSLALRPAWPVFQPEKFDYRSANLWEYGKRVLFAKQGAQSVAAERAEWAATEAKAARLEAGQSKLLADAVDKLTPRDPARANVFTLGVAGWSDQDVFLKEIRQSTDILASHFHWGERTLNLINNPSVAQEAPMASMENIGAALAAVGRRMDRDNDLLVLVLSSHGSQYGFALRNDDMVERTLDPETLRLSLDAAGVKNRVIIVSSCYAGKFVAPLQNPDTMILTAASAERTSFGCSDDRRWTWFGEALFEKGLSQQPTLSAAFSAARATISGWEREQDLPASQPQIFVGEAISRKFPDIVGASLPESHAAAEPAPAKAKTE